MTTLFDQFVAHYAEVALMIQSRRLFENAWSDIDRTNEVKAIRSFLLDKTIGVDYMNKHVAPALSKGPFHIKFASIFCHQKPRVRRTFRNQNKNAGDTNGCELGDLFVVFVLLDNTDKLHYAAGSLFQAKLRPTLDSLSQKCLYDFDNDFDVPSYLEKRVVPSNKNRVMPSYDEGRSRAFRYLILEPDHSKENVTARHTPWVNNQQKRWSTFLDGLLSGVDGLRANLTTNSPSSWDIIVADLLSVGLNVPTKKAPRGNNVAVKIATSLFNNFKNLEDYSATLEQDHPGVPTLMVIAHAYEYRQTE